VNSDKKISTAVSESFTFTPISTTTGNGIVTNGGSHTGGTSSSQTSVTLGNACSNVTNCN
jgi:hypothetical protein